MKVATAEMELAPTSSFFNFEGLEKRKNFTRKVATASNEKAFSKVSILGSFLQTRKTQRIFIFLSFASGSEQH